MRKDRETEKERKGWEQETVTDKEGKDKVGEGGGWGGGRGKVTCFAFFIFNKLSVTNSVWNAAVALL
jgi:hypothetical protein